MALALTKSATSALAQLMVPAQATYNDRELLMLARLQASVQAEAVESGRDMR